MIGKVVTLKLRSVTENYNPKIYLPAISRFIFQIVGPPGDPGEPGPPVINILDIATLISSCLVLFNLNTADA